MQEMTLTLHCPDAVGIVASVANFFSAKQINIVSSKQHTEEMGRQFFMRVHLSYAHAPMDMNELRENFATEVGQPFSMKWSLHPSDAKEKMAIMVSLYDHCLYDLLLRYQYGELHSDIVAIISNHKKLSHVARHFDVPFIHIPVVPELKHEAEVTLLDTLKELDVSLIVLARYMQVLSAKVVDTYPNQIINVHHGFLPAFKGAKPYHQAYEKGVKIIGATSHYVTEELDDGPIISQATVPVTHAHSANDMMRMGRDLEKQVLSEAVKAHLEHRILLASDRTITF